MKTRTSLPLLTTSSGRAYRACPRLYYYSYELGIRPVYVDENRTFGTLGHHGLEAWSLTAMATPMRDEWLNAGLEAIRNERDALNLDAFALAKAEAMMSGYHTRWEDDDLQILAVEREFSGPLVNPTTQHESKTWRRGGKIDAICRWRGRLCTLERKTSAEDIRVGADYWTRLTLDSQISNYMVGARLLGYPVEACMFDVLKKPQLKPLKATPEEARKFTKSTKADPVPRLYAGQRETDETPNEYFDRVAAAISKAPDDYYQRAEIVRFAHEETEAALDTWHLGIQIKDSRRLGIWPRNPDACSRYNRTCDWLPVCTGTASLDDGTRYRKTKRAHEELSSQSAMPKEEANANDHEHC